MATKPKLSELCSLKCRDGSNIEIITSIAPMWKDFGVLLEFDDDGTKLNLIEANQRVNGPAACCTEMFQTWVKGAGRQPASWDLASDWVVGGLWAKVPGTTGQSSTVGWGGREEYSQTITMVCFILLNVYFVYDNYGFCCFFFQQQYSIIVIQDILHHCTNRLVGTTTMKERQGERIIIFVFYFLFWRF